MITPLHPNKRDSKQVETLAGLGASLEYIASHLNLSTDQVLEFYKKDLDYGKEHANLEVAETFFELATSGEHPTITMAWMRMRAGWRDTPQTTTQENDDVVEVEQAREKLLKLLNRGK